MADDLKNRGAQDRSRVRRDRQSAKNGKMPSSPLFGT